MSKSAHKAGGIKWAENSRLAAVQVLAMVLQEGQSLSTSLPQVQSKLIESKHSACVQAISNGVLRDYFRLHAILSELLRQPLKSRDSDVQYLLLIGLHELSEKRSPDYAIVSEVVQCVSGLGKVWAKGLINAVLRNFIRQRETLQSKMDLQTETRFSAPEWLIDAIRRDWPEDWQIVLTALRQQAPMVLRVNLNQWSRHDYLKRLEAQSIEAKSLDLVPSAIELVTPCDVQRLPEFSEGGVSVQDTAAQLAAVLLVPQAGEHVLDACAAPGGKTLHLLEQQPQHMTLVAVELQASRAERIRENLQRAKIATNKVDLKVADVLQLNDWWDGQPFQKILLDVPCSATGVIRRHPDIKLLRRPEDIATLVGTQAALLDRVWPLLAANGVLLYCTCSILKRENEEQVGAFLSRTTDAEFLPLLIPGAYNVNPGYQLLPGVHGTDGFFYAALRKQTS